MFSPVCVLCVCVCVYVCVCVECVHDHLMFQNKPEGADTCDTMMHRHTHTHTFFLDMHVESTNASAMELFHAFLSEHAFSREFIHVNM